MSNKKYYLEGVFKMKIKVESNIISKSQHTSAIINDKKIAFAMLDGYNWDIDSVEKIY